MSSARGDARGARATAAFTPATTPRRTRSYGCAPHAVTTGASTTGRLHRGIAAARRSSRPNPAKRIRRARTRSKRELAGSERPTCVERGALPGRRRSQWRPRHFGTSDAAVCTRSGFVGHAACEGTVLAGRAFLAGPARQRSDRQSPLRQRGIRGRLGASHAKPSSVSPMSLASLISTAKVNALKEALR